MAEARSEPPSDYDAEAIPPLTAPTTAQRLSIPTGLRIPLATLGGFATGGILGASYGGRTAALRFRAENAHRLPTTTKGWYLYHKSKNYNVILAAVKEGLKMGAKIGFWAGGFFWLEAAIDRSRRDRKDFLSTTLTGITIAGAFSLWNRFPLTTAARVTKFGLVTGLTFGLVQDALSLARGRRLAYVDFMLGRPRDGAKARI